MPAAPAAAIPVQPNRRKDAPVKRKAEEMPKTELVVDAAVKAKPEEPKVPAASLGELYSKCVQMVNENKVSTKNAFDLKLTDHMHDIVDSFMGGAKRKAEAAKDNISAPARDAPAPTKPQNGADSEENKFLEASSAIEASARIYAVRVDCVHSDTYRVLGGLNSADMDEEEDIDGADGKASKKRRIVGVNTLERNEKNIIQQNIEADEQSDPMFRRMAAAFDAGGARGLLLTHLPLAEDLSLVFNGDVPLTRAAEVAKKMFVGGQPLKLDDLGMGDASAASQRLETAKLCPELDAFRRQLWGNVSTDVELSSELQALLGSAITGAAPLLAGMQNAELGVLQDGAVGDLDDGMMAIPDPEPLDVPQGEAFPFGPNDGDTGAFGGGNSVAELGSLPLADMEPFGTVSSTPRNQDAIAFDELFDKFCAGGASSNFAYFDGCWAGGVKEPKSSQLVLADEQANAGEIGGNDGQLVAADGKAVRQPKRPLFDLSGLDRPLKPIEYEPAHKHQLSERQAAWQLQKDVPPYMIDRITMPSWPSWSKCDFACLGLRPHLMLKLVKKPPPPGDGPHSFSELFSTVVVENPDAFPWMATESGTGGQSADRGDFEGGAGYADAGDEEGDEFDGSGLPAHLDVDPQELFLRPDDRVVPDCGDDMADGNGDFDGPPGLELDFDLVDQPTTCGDNSIQYSRNSKFVDVKLVKKHLWDCISDDITRTKASSGDGEVSSTSFQQLVNRTVQRMPKSECGNLSIQVCFICALHLCNEKGLELKTDPNVPLGDFAVVGSETLSPHSAREEA
jgi:hypothetical protein